MDKWLKYAENSLAEAIKAAKVSSVSNQNLYKLAPILYSEQFKTKNSQLIQEMSDTTDEMVKEDWSHDRKSKDQYRFHYVSSYLYCFVVAGKFDEMKYDRIMEYVCTRMGLFTDDYGQV